MAILPIFDDGQNEQNGKYAKKPKGTKIKVFIIRITPKAFQLTARVRSLL